MSPPSSSSSSSPSPSRSSLTQADDRPLALVLLLLGTASISAVVHAVFVPRHLPGAFAAALPYLLVGWATFGTAFYALGRLVASPDRLPRMRAADLGVALFVGSVVLSGLLDAAGFPIETTPTIHILPAVGIYLGLALAGWGIGERSKAIARITSE